MKYEPKRSRPDLQVLPVSARPTITYRSTSLKSGVLVGVTIEALVVSVELEELGGDAGIALCVTYQLPDDEEKRSRRRYHDRMNLWHASVWAQAANVSLVTRWFAAAGVRAPAILGPSVEPFLTMIGRRFKIQINASISDGRTLYYVSSWERIS